MAFTSDTGSLVGAGQLVTCRLDELRPHPSYVRHQFSVPAFQLSVLAERGDRAFAEPLVITRDRTILDGYARLELARLRGRAMLPCIEYDLPESEALHWLLQKHRRSNGLNDFSRVLLALDLEPWFKEKARSNQQAGGRCKGSSKLTANDDMRRALRLKQAASALEADEAFHNVWLARAQNGELYVLVQQLKTRLRRVELAYWKRATRTGQSVGEHEELLKELQNGSKRLAIVALKRNWEGARERVQTVAISEAEQRRDLGDTQ